jgi:hypothetical protein
MQLFLKYSYGLLNIWWYLLFCGRVSALVMIRIISREYKPSKVKNSFYTVRMVY